VVNNNEVFALNNHFKFFSTATMLSLTVMLFGGIKSVSAQSIDAIDTFENTQPSDENNIIVTESGAAYYGYLIEKLEKKGEPIKPKNTIPPLPDKPIRSNIKLPIPALPDLDRNGNKKQVQLPPLPDRDKWGNKVYPTLPPLKYPLKKLPLPVDPKLKNTIPAPAPIPSQPIPKAQPKPDKPAIVGKVVGKQCGWVTAYSPGNSGTLTANGKNVFSIPHKFVAHRSFPFGTKVYEIDEKDINSPDILSKVKKFYGVKEDYGPNESTGHDLDLWMRSDYDATQWGRRYKCWVGVK
jgi:3D (Asp-Asp-Asp) domain-containing protein